MADEPLRSPITIKGCDSEEGGARFDLRRVQSRPPFWQATRSASPAPHQQRWPISSTREPRRLMVEETRCGCPMYLTLGQSPQLTLCFAPASRGITGSVPLFLPSLLSSFYILLKLFNMLMGATVATTIVALAATTFAPVAPSPPPRHTVAIILSITADRSTLR